MNSNINLKDMTQLELFDLRQKVNNELDEYSKREKIATCTIKQKDMETRYFYKKSTAYEVLQEIIDNREAFDIEITCCLTFLTVEQRKELCEDFI